MFLRTPWSVSALALVLSSTPIAVQAQPGQQGGLPVVQAQVQALEQQLAAVRTGLDDLSAEVDAQDAPLQAQITTLSGEVAALQDLFDSLNIAVNTASADILALQEHATALEEAVNDLRDQLTSGPQTRVFRYMTFDTYLETCCWNANDDASLFGGVNPSKWTDGNGLASHMSSDAETLHTLFVRKMYPGKNALVSSERWSDRSSTNGKVTAVLMRIRNSTSSGIQWRPFFYFTAYASWGERASVALNGVNVWNSGGDHHSYSTAAPVLTLPANQTSTVIFVVPSSPPWSGSASYRLNFFAFSNNSLNLPPGLSYVDDLDSVTGNLW